MKFTNGRALIVGVADYAEVKPLPEAVRNDARDIADLLRSPNYCGYPDDNVKVLINSEANLNGIRAALADLASSATADDTVTIFFSGHGAQLGAAAARSSALIPYDCKLSDIAGTSLPEIELTAALANIKAARLLVILDACHAGGAASLKGESDDGFLEGFDEKSLQGLAIGVGRVVIASSRSSETSLVLAGARNSVFTTAILDGLKGGASASLDGTIKVFDLFNYVSEMVRKAVPGRQHPIFKASDLEENFPIALALGGNKSVHTDRVENSPNRTLQAILPDLYPAGPSDQNIWQRAGGDLSQVQLGSTGRADWFSALRTLSLGGGGNNISMESLINAALEEFPNHRELKALL